MLRINNAHIPVYQEHKVGLDGGLELVNGILKDVLSSNIRKIQ